MLKVDFWKSLSLQNTVAPIRRSAVVILRGDETPHVARRGTHQRLRADCLAGFQAVQSRFDFGICPDRAVSKPSARSMGSAA